MIGCVIYIVTGLNQGKDIELKKVNRKFRNFIEAKEYP